VKRDRDDHLLDGTQPKAARQPIKVDRPLGAQQRSLMPLLPAPALLPVRGSTNGKAGVAGSIPAGLHHHPPGQAGPEPDLGSLILFVRWRVRRCNRNP
jgi:hypothetical protein